MYEFNNAKFAGVKYMKIYSTLIILLLTLCIFFVGCTFQEEAKLSNDIQNDNIEEGEKATETYSTVEDLIIALSNTGENTQTNGNNSSIETIYEPAADFEGFKLFQVELVPNAIIYYYLPIDSERNFFMYDEGIQVTCYREGKLLDYSLEKIAEREDLECTEDGYLYRSVYNEINFTVGNTIMSITVPDSMNDYETLKELCVARKVTAGNQPTDSLETE